MLHLLMDYARDENLTPEVGFTAKAIRWGLLFDNDGQLEEVIDFSNGDKKSKGRHFSKIPALSQPELVGGTTAKSQCLYESAETVALLLKTDEDEKKRIKTIGKHRFFVEALKDCANHIESHSLAVVANSLSDTDQCVQIAARLKEEKVKSGDTVTIGIENRWLLGTNTWHEWWRNFRVRLSSNNAEKKSTTKKRTISDAPLMLDLVTGTPIKPFRSHLKISGLADVGGLDTGDSFISFDKDAFSSFGLQKGANAAISEENATVYQQALNHLIANQSRRLGIGKGKSKVVYWYKGKITPSCDPIELIFPAPNTKNTAGDEIEVEENESDKQKNKSVALANARKLLESLRSGEQRDLADAAYYSMIISGASGRVMIRDWMEGQFGQLTHNIVEWFEDFEIVARDGDDVAPSPKFMAVMGATVRDLKDLNSPFTASMWRAALGGRQIHIPQSALAAAYARFKIDLISLDEKSQKLKPFNHARMGLIKAYHIRKGVTVTTELDEKMDNVPYQCGRLMAILADIQRAALGDVGAGVIQRYYAAASATPALVFGRLIRNSTFHLDHIAKTKGQKVADIRIGELAQIFNVIKDRIPKMLTLEEQTLFALGYYQQIAAIRKKITEAVAAQKANSTQNSSESYSKTTNLKELLP